MIQSLFSAANSMISQQSNIDTIGNNVANINTNGYKKVRLDFKDAIYERMQSPTDNSAAMNLQRGAGALVNQTLRVYDQGALKSTENPFDIALEGPGFFKMRAPDGSYVYSRNGQFGLSNEADGAYLVDENGYYVMDNADNRILVRGVPSKMVVDATGAFTFTDTDGTAIAGPALSLNNFDNPPGLSAVGSFYFAPSENSGAARALQGPTAVKQQVVEASNVDYSEEVTRLIRAQRAYQLAARAISTADQMAQSATTIRG